MNSNYQIWDDGEMPGPVPENATFKATPESLDGLDGYRITATVDGHTRDCGWVNGSRVNSAEDAIAAVEREHAARRKIYGSK